LELPPSPTAALRPVGAKSALLMVAPKGEEATALADRGGNGKFSAEDYKLMQIVDTWCAHGAFPQMYKFMAEFCRLMSTGFLPL
jgi:hypothetical protein